LAMMAMMAAVIVGPENSPQAQSLIHLIAFREALF